MKVLFLLIFVFFSFKSFAISKDEMLFTSNAASEVKYQIEKIKKAKLASESGDSVNYSNIEHDLKELKISLEIASIASTQRRPIKPLLLNYEAWQFNSISDYERQLLTEVSKDLELIADSFLSKKQQADSSGKDRINYKQLILDFKEVQFALFKTVQSSPRRIFNNQL